MTKSLYLAPIVAALAILAIPVDASDKLQVQAAEDGVVDAARQCDVFVAGTASSRSATPLKYRWRDGKSLVSQWQDVRADHTAPLELCGLSVGSHKLTLEVDDGRRIATSSMTATIVAPSGLVASNAGR